jgi:hypothetical protein
MILLTPKKQIKTVLRYAKGWRNQVKKTLKNVNVTPNNNMFLA